ncbi:MAG: glycosyltransferase family 9 protein [Candidatus Omnitrophota bacterium]
MMNDLSEDRFMPKTPDNILFITLSNIGDVILTFPVLDAVIEEYPEARISVMTGPKGKSFFLANDRVESVFVYDKQRSWLQKLRWFTQLRKYKFDLIIDLRHSVAPLLIGGKRGTPLIRKRVPGQHMRDYHFSHIRRMRIRYWPKKRHSWVPSLEDLEAVEEKFDGKILANESYIVIAPGAADHRKRWTPEGFAKAADQLSQEEDLKVVIVGDERDRTIAEQVESRMRRSVMDLCGQISLTQLGVVLRGAELLLTNDSAPLHFAGYLDVPTVAVFGPTDPACYGPWSSHSAFIRRHEQCPACQSADLDGEHACMQAVSADEVVDTAQRLLHWDRVIGGSG